MWICAPNSLG